jgi:nucleoside-diphosphate-sugar epimerase
MKILLTGSSGMIGTALYEKLKKKQVICIDKRENPWYPNLNTHIHDLTKPLKLSDELNMGILLAANARVYELVEHPELAKENIDIVYNSLEFCRKHDIGRIIFSS